MDILNNGNDICGFTIYWRIENFDSQLSFDYLKSQIFKIQCMDSNWQIHINYKKNNQLGAFLHKETNSTHFVVHYSLFLLTGSGWVNIFENSKQRFKAGGEGYGGYIVTLDNLKKEEWFYLPNGSLTIRFRMWNNHIKNESSQRLMISRLIAGNHLLNRPIQTFTSLRPNDLFSFPLSYQFQTFTSLRPNDLVSFPLSYQFLGNSQSTLVCQNSKEVKTQQTQTNTAYDFKDLDDLCELLKKMEFSFVTLRTPSKDFSVHKAVLCAKSPVFNAMFERKMKENDSNVVDIDDIDSQTMALFVKFLHFQPVEELEWCSAVSLYYAADKYQIDSLKKQCVSLLKKKLSIETICELLLLADLHEDDDLMNCASEYFCQHSKAIFLSQQWRNILGHTELVANLLCKLAKTTH